MQFLNFNLLQFSPTFLPNEKILKFVFQNLALDESSTKKFPNIRHIMKYEHNLFFKDINARLALLTLSPLSLKVMKKGEIMKIEMEIPPKIEVIDQGTKQNLLHPHPAHQTPLQPQPAEQTPLRPQPTQQILRQKIFLHPLTEARKKKLWQRRKSIHHPSPPPAFLITELEKMKSLNRMKKWKFQERGI
jgi:hypothetical protein